MSGDRLRAGRYRTVVSILIGVLLAAVGLAIVALLAIDTSTGGRLFGTGLMVGLYCLTALACLFVWERGRWRPVALVGIGLSALGVPIFGFGIWYNFANWRAEQVYFCFVGGHVTVTLLCAHLCLLRLARLQRKWAWLVGATQGCAVLLALLLLLALLSRDPGYHLTRFVGVVALLTACGTICVPILHWTQNTRVQQPTITTSLMLQIVCPRCNTPQQIAAGRASCRQCGLTFRIEIEEERCRKCGYVLYRLTSDRCPECGTPVLAKKVAEAPPQQNGAPHT